ncbi:MAG: MFS transporter, partial [Alphaproteobacteria bacterium]|nr:MFS transporter [Alphaproteobacteria bacterium]
PFVTEIWQIYVLVFVLQSCSAAFTPTFQATIPDVLPDEEDYTRALSLSRLAYDLESLLSPSIAAALLTVASYGVLFQCNAIGFVASAVLVLSVTLPRPRPVDRIGGIYAKLTYGIGVYLATPRLRGLLALGFSVSAAGSMIIVNTVVYARDVLGGTDRDVATLMLASGIGSIVAALALPRLLDRLPERPIMLAGGGALAVVLALAATMPGSAVAFVLWALIGAASSVVQTPAGRLLRRSAHPEDRPALFSAQFALSHACWLLTYPLAGWLGATAGLAPTFVVMAALVIVGVAAAVILWPSVETEAPEHEHAAVEHDHLHVHDAHHPHDHAGDEGPEPHRHPHRHAPVRHAHRLVIDAHHPVWPR